MKVESARQMRSVELFAGGGGLALGAHQAGFTNEVVAEWDNWSCSTIRRNQEQNHPLVQGVRVFEGDVRAYDWGTVKDGVDLVSGGPPCQPFSMGGKAMAANDPRDMFPATAEVIRMLRPKAFVLENVRGLTRPALASYFAYTQLRLANPDITPREGESWKHHYQRLQSESVSLSQNHLQYDVSVKLVNAADYGVPQHRWRVFIIGFRADLKVGWQFPEPTHSGASLKQFQESGCYWEKHQIPLSQRVSELRVGKVSDSCLEPWVTVRDALHDLPEPKPKASGEINNHLLKLGARSYPGHTGSYIDSPSKALKAGVHGVPGGENMVRFFDGSVRYFTVREAARLQTFPDSYLLDGPWSEAMRQIGNAVPVQLARVVCTSVFDALKPLSTNERSVKVDSTLVGAR